MKLFLKTADMEILEEQASLVQMLNVLKEQAFLVETWMKSLRNKLP